MWPFIANYNFSIPLSILINKTCAKIHYEKYFTYHREYRLPKFFLSSFTEVMVRFFLKSQMNLSFGNRTELRKNLGISNRTWEI